MASRCAFLSEVGPLGDRLGSSEVYGDDIGYKLCSQGLSSDKPLRAGAAGDGSSGETGGGWSRTERVRAESRLAWREAEECGINTYLKVRECCWNKQSL
jgi:hypothetical protein